MFICIESTDGTDMLVNIDHILAVKEKGKGSIIYMVSNTVIASGASPKQVMQAILKATTSLEVRS